MYIDLFNRKKPIWNANNQPICDSIDYNTNEIAISNLFAAANNEKIFNSLQDETQKKLIDALVAYTELCLDKTLSSSNPEIEQVNNKILEKRLK